MSATRNRSLAAEIASMVEHHAPDNAQTYLEDAERRPLTRIERLCLGHTIDDGERRPFSRAELRLSEINRLIDYRHGGTIPENDDPKNGYVFLFAHVVHAHLDADSDQRSFMLKWLQRVALWIEDPGAVVDGLMAGMHPRRKHMRDRAAGLVVNLKARERALLGIRTISPADLTPLQFKKARKKAKRIADREYRDRKRRDQGAKPQTKSAARAEEWVIAGCSKATWYRRKRANETDSSHACSVSSEGRETVSSPLIDSRIGRDETVSTVASVPTLAPSLFDLLPSVGDGIRPSADRGALHRATGQKQRADRQPRDRKTPGSANAAGLCGDAQIDLFDGESR